MNAKDVVRMFNLEVIEQGKPETAARIFAPGFINHSAPTGTNNGAEGMLSTFNNILRPALSGLKVEILDQIAEGDKVTTRKRITGTHTGPLMGIAPTAKPVAIEVIDIVRVQNDQYVEHWGLNNLPTVIAQLRS